MRPLSNACTGLRQVRHHREKDHSAQALHLPPSDHERTVGSLTPPGLSGLDRHTIPRSTRVWRRAMVGLEEHGSRVGDLMGLLHYVCSRTLTLTCRRQRRHRGR
jgi:hypothetical protein